MTIKYKDVIKSKEDAEFNIAQVVHMSAYDTTELINQLAISYKIDMSVDDWISMANWANEQFVKHDMTYSLLNLYIKTIPLRNQLNGIN